MSGNINFRIRKGRSKDPRYPYYPEVVLEVTGECGNKVDISPSYNDLFDILKTLRKHELKIDATRERRKYVSILITQLEELLASLKQLKLSDFDKKNMEDVFFYGKRSDNS